jgi:hypothetical protein
MDIPNIFGGGMPSYIPGLLGQEETAALQKRANVQGLLGAALSLAQGMSPVGPRRSAAQNILGAIAGGFQASQGAYQGALQNYSTQQQLMQQQRQMDAINKVLDDPNIDDATKAFVRANPQDGLKMVAEMQMFQRQREKFMPQAAPAPAPAQLQVEGLPAIEVTTNSEIAKLEQQIQGSLADASAYNAMRDPVRAEASTRNAERLRERQMQLAAAEIDIDQRIAVAPEQFKDQYRTIKSIKGSLKPIDILSSIQNVDKAVQESSKQYKYEGIVGQYAFNQFGTNDATKLTPEQNRNVLAYSNAPTQADQTKIAIDAQKLRFETGSAPALPTSREQMLGGAQQPVTQMPAAPVVRPSEVSQAVQQAPVPSPDVSRPAIPQAVAPQPAAQKAPTIKPTEVPLVQKPDSVVPMKRKQELVAAKPSTISLVNYSLKNIVDSRDAAQRILDNPSYVEALTGFTAPVIASIPNTDAYTANELMKNLLSRAFITEIQSMRAASPTGGAVGNVAVAEMDSLSKIQASLTLGMKKEEFKKQLQQYINNANRAIKTIPKEFANTYGYAGEFEEILSGGVVDVGSETIVNKQSVDEELRRRKGNKGAR